MVCHRFDWHPLLQPAGSHILLKLGVDAACVRATAAEYSTFTFGRIQVGGRRPNFTWLNRYNSAAGFSISLQCGTSVHYGLSLIALSLNYCTVTGAKSPAASCNASQLPPYLVNTFLFLLSIRFYLRYTTSISNN